MNITVNRPPRQHPDAPEAHELTLAEPPKGNPPSRFNPIQALLPALGGLGMVMFMLSNGNPLFLMAGIVMLVVTVGGALASAIQQATGGRREFSRQRDKYLEYLEAVREDMRTDATRQSIAADFVHRDPRTLATWAVTPRVYERRRSDADFGEVRVGVGRAPHPVKLLIPKPRNPLEQSDAVCQRAVEAVVSAHRTIANQPLCVPLGTASSVVITGASHADALAGARAVIMQLAACHAPADMHIAVVSPAVDTDFGWARWLPHCLDPHARDGVVPRSWLAQDLDALSREVRDYIRDHQDELSKLRHIGSAPATQDRLVVIVDEWSTGPTGGIMVGDSSAASGELGVCMVRLVREPTLEPEHVDARVTVVGGDIRIDGTEQGVLSGLADRPSAADALALARTLAPRMAAVDVSIEEPLESNCTLADLIKLDDVATWTPDPWWGERTRREMLRVPIGVRSDGHPLVLDLKESAFDGMGPHGVLVGATGSGKSELLRSLVLALALTHSPEHLAMVLVDFKGGATFAGLDGMPHVAGMVTNLQSDLDMVDRFRDALTGELTRRQQILFDAGNLPNVFAYDAARRRDPSLEPLPHLLVIVDEFAELLTAKPDFLDLFTAIGRIGRSIGVHQLLASQRLDDGRMRGLESFLSYRLALRTFNAEESRAVIGVPDAFELPSSPGNGYLKVDTTIFERFKAAYVSGPYRQSTTAPVQAAPTVQPIWPRNTTPRENVTGVMPVRADDADGDTKDVGPTVLETAVSRMEGRAATVHQVWLPPLSKNVGFGDVDAFHAPRPGSLIADVGILDLPKEQRQETIALDFAGSEGNLAILGGPQTGRSTALRTIAHALARNLDPGQVAIHCVDFGGGTLRALRGLPHVGTVAGRLDMDTVRRTFAEFVSTLDAREELFARHDIAGVEDLRRRYRAGELPELKACDLFLFVDGYNLIRDDFDDLHDQLIAICQRGLGYGVHVVLTANRWFDVRSALQTSIPGKLELRLVDPLDSGIERKTSMLIPADAPGRVAVAEGKLGQLALPVAGSYADEENFQATVEATLSTLEAQHVAQLAAPHTEAVEPIKLLPHQIKLVDVLAHPDAPKLAAPGYKRLRPATLGIAEDTLGPVSLDLTGDDSHLLIFGDQGSGKSTILRSVAQQLLDNASDEELVFGVVDPRRTMLGFIPDDYLAAYAPTPGAAASLADSLVQEVLGRQPSTIDPAELINHRWAGPRVVLLVDDFELVSGSGQNALQALSNHLAGARDIGLHVIIARSAGGAGRALFDPMLQRIKELAAPAILLSGDREEGQLWPRVSMQPLPPGRGIFVRRGVKPRLIQVAQPEERS